MVVAADAFAQMVLSPLLGVIIDKIKSVRLVCIICSAMFAGGNVFYALLGLVPRGDVKIRVWLMLVSRVLVGSGTTINSAARFYVTAATLLSERTTHIALFSLFQTLGFLVGPGVMVRPMKNDNFNQNICNSPLPLGCSCISQLRTHP